MSSGTSECPMCFETFSKSVIQTHASSCNGKPPSTSKRPIPSSPLTSPQEIPSKRIKAESGSGINGEGKRPLAELMRPKTLDEYFGQDEIAGKTSFWRPFFEDSSSTLPSMIFWGPPGCGKTSLANVIGTRCKERSSHLRFVKLSACTSGVADVKDAIAKAKNEKKMFKRSTVLFIDEVHRFNKLQQDAFLPHVEDGTVTLIGATTENPSFSLNKALLSRCHVMMLQKLPELGMKSILKRALDYIDVRIVVGDDPECTGMAIKRDAFEYLTKATDGDARTALNCLETFRDKGLKKTIEIDEIKESLKSAPLSYNRTGDDHYHCASALQKSIRGSDDNAALYWTMRMLECGEDPMFIARRFVRIASEDVGLGDPGAINIAVSTMQGCQLIGKLECDVLLAQCAVYLARANKSHEVYGAMCQMKELLQDKVKHLPPVPLHLRNASSKLDREMGAGKGYSYDLSKVKNIEYMPDGVEFRPFKTT